MTAEAAERGRVVIAPSLYAAPLLALGDAVRSAAIGGADAFHLDVMDGHFVAPISFGNLIVHAVRASTTLPLDAHLMVSNPHDHLDWLAEAGVRTVTVHVEAFVGGASGAVGTLRAIRSRGMRPGIAMKPGTDLQAVEALVDEVDHVLVMTVEPGTSGQPFLATMLPKVHAVVARFGHAVEVGVDGGINEETAREALRAGARYLVAGSAVFGSGEDSTAAAIARIRCADAERS